MNDRSVEFFDRLVFGAIPKPTEKGEESDGDQDFVEEKTNERNHSEEPFKDIAQEIPETGHDGVELTNTNIAIGFNFLQPNFAYF